VFDWLARSISNRNVAWGTVTVVLLLAAASLLLARRVEHEDDLLAFLPRDNAEVKAFYEINKRFGGLDVALVGIEADDVFAPDFLERLRRVTRELRETPGLNHVLSLANVIDFSPDREHGGIVTGPLVSRLPSSPEERTALRSKVLSRELVVGNLVSAHGKAVLIYCFLALGTDVKSISAQVQRLVTATFPGEHKYWGGNPFISSYIYNTTQEDIRRLTPWAGLAIVLIMMVAFRDVIATCLALLSTGIGIVMALGLMGALGVKFNIVLGSMPIIMLALGSAYAIHVLARYYSLAQDADTETAVRRTVKGVGPTVVAAGLTTVVSLLSFVCMDIQPLRIFGLFTAIGLTIKLVLSVTFIPAVVRLLNLKRRPTSSVALRRATSALAAFAATHRLAVGGLLGALAVTGAILASRVDTRLDSSAFFSAGSPPDEAEKYLRHHFGGSQFIQVQVRGDMTDPGVLREVQRMADELSLLPRVSSVMHVGQAVAQVQNAMTGQNRIPDTTAQVKLLYSFLTGDPSVRQLVADDRSEALLQVKVDSNRAADLDTLLATVERWAAAQDVREYVTAAQARGREPATAARRRRLVLARIRAVAHAAGLELSAETARRLEEHVADPPGRLDPRLVEEAMVQFLRSEEVAVELPARQGADDPAGRVAAALAALGPEAKEADLAPAVAGALHQPVGDSTVEDLVLSVSTPLREMWFSERATQRAAHLAAAAGLTLPAGRTGQRLFAGLSSALMDLEAPAVLLPAGTDRASGTLGLQVTGLPLMNRGLSRSVMGNQLKSLTFALLLVFIVMTVLFRSARSGLLGMTPALLTLLIIYGGMGLLGVRLDIGTSMLASIVIGAGVDYAIHLVAAWRASPDGSLRTAAATGADRAGLAVWTNAVMIAAGFFVLTLGQARPLKNVGGLTAAAMLAAAFATFLAIPVLARRPFYRRAVDTELEETAAPPPEAVPARPGSAADR
jgi:predicted RND superfamily exporter protein